MSVLKSILCSKDTDALASPVSSLLSQSEQWVCWPQAEHRVRAASVLLGVSIASLASSSHAADALAAPATFLLAWKAGVLGQAAGTRRDSGKEPAW